MIGKLRFRRIRASFIVSSMNHLAKKKRGKRWSYPWEEKRRKIVWLSTRWEASPYLVAHRRIIDVIRIMYPRNWDRRKEEGGNRRGRCVLILAYTRIEGRCVYKGNGNHAVTKRSLQTGASLSFSLPLFPTFDTPPRIRGVPPSPCITYSSFFFFLRTK